jgi:hypothetical protein
MLGLRGIQMIKGFIMLTTIFSTIKKAKFSGIVALISVTGLTACANLAEDIKAANEPQTSFADVKRIDTVIKSWGPAQNVQKLADGGSLYQWSFTQNENTYPHQASIYPGTGVSAFSHWPSSASRLYPGWWSHHGNGFYPGPQSLIVNRPVKIENSCVIDLRTDANGMIIDRQHRGDACNL